MDINFPDVIGDDSEEDSDEEYQFQDIIIFFWKKGNIGVLSLATNDTAGMVTAFDERTKNVGVNYFESPKDAAADILKSIKLTVDNGWRTKGIYTNANKGRG